MSITEAERQPRLRQFPSNDTARKRDQLDIYAVLCKSLSDPLSEGLQPVRALGKQNKVYLPIQHRTLPLDTHFRNEIQTKFFCDHRGVPAHKK